MLYFQCDFKESAAIYCITVHSEKGLFPSTLTGHITLVFK
jgi:hypothetical protein